MATHVFNEFLRALAAGEVDLLNDDIRVVPCMSNTTADTENDGIVTVDDITTLDEFDGTGYTAGGNALDNVTVTKVDGSDRAVVDADDEAFGTLGAGTRAIQGMLVIKYDTSLAASLPIAWLEYSTNKTMDGSAFTAVWGSDGLFYAQGA